MTTEQAQEIISLLNVGVVYLEGIGKLLSLLICGKVINFIITGFGGREK